MDFKELYKTALRKLDSLSDQELEEFVNPKQPERSIEEMPRITLEELPEPIGNFIFANAKGLQASDGMYYHYADVCNLLDKYATLVSGQSDAVKFGVWLGFKYHRVSGWKWVENMDENNKTEYSTQQLYTLYQQEKIQNQSREWFVESQIKSAPLTQQEKGEGK